MPKKKWKSKGGENKKKRSKIKKVIIAAFSLLVGWVKTPVLGIQCHHDPLLGLTYQPINPCRALAELPSFSSLPPHSSAFLITPHHTL